MRLTLQTDYALRTLIYLSSCDAECPPVRQIAAAYGISQPHLVKVVQLLAQEGFVETRPGRGGGVRLAQRPDEIRVGDVVRRMEPSLAPVVCLNPAASEGCVIAPACGLVAPLQEATEHFLAILDRYTVADCARRRGPLRDLLQIGRARPAPTAG